MLVGRLNAMHECPTRTVESPDVPLHLAVVRPVFVRRASRILARVAGVDRSRRAVYRVTRSSGRPDQNAQRCRDGACGVGPRRYGLPGPTARWARSKPIQPLATKRATGHVRADRTGVRKPSGGRIPQLDGVTGAVRPGRETRLPRRVVWRLRARTAAVPETQLRRTSVVPRVDGPGGREQDSRVRRIQ